MNLFNFDQIHIDEVLTFFMVVVRYGTLFAVLPLIGDRVVPAPLKILFAIAVSFALYPTLVKTGQIRPAEAELWSATSPRMIATIAFEVLYALAMGFVAKLAFDAINLGGNLVGNFMGFGMASTYDPHQESQTQVVAEFHLAVAMLMFLALDGHHLMLRAALESYQILGIGGMLGMFQHGIDGAFSQKLVDLTQMVIRFGVQISAPIALSLFAVNVAFGVMAKAMPQLNVLVLSFSVSALVGLFILFVNLSEFSGLSGQILGHMGEWMRDVTRVLAGA